MWRPPQRIKWQPQPGRWPSAAEAAASKLFSPIQVGPLTLNNRTWVPAMVPWRATEDGYVTEHVIDWYARFAKGRPGAIVIEATGIRDVPSGPLLRIGDDRFIPGLKDLVEAVRVASGGETKLFIQIIDFLNLRRRPEPEKFLGRFLRITDDHRAKLDMKGADEGLVRDRLLTMADAELDAVLDERELESLRMGFRERVTDMHVPHIRDLPQVLPDLFANAAVRARTAGFDGVELHYAHAYTMASLLSARNNRPDGYGGSRENRVRLPLEVFARVREAVGPDYCVGCRFLTADCIEGGSTVEDATYYAVKFAEAGFDFLSTSRGGRFEDAKQPGVGEAAYPYTGPSGYECMPQYVSDEQGPFGRNVKPAATVHEAVRKAGYSAPVMVAGGIHGFEQAEAILQAGQADIIGLARQTLADPDWPLKVILGRGDEVRVCEYTNYCEALDQKHAVVTCKLWDRKGHKEPGVKTTPDGKRRMTPPDWTP